MARRIFQLGTGALATMNLIRKIVKYFQEVRAETAKVTWPSRAQTIRLTVIVLVASVLIGLYVGSLDLLFTTILSVALPS